MGDNVDWAGGLIDVGGGAAVEGRDAAALSAGDAVVALPPEELLAGGVGGPGVVQENITESGRGPSWPSPPPLVSPLSCSTCRP